VSIKNIFRNRQEAFSRGEPTSPTEKAAAVWNDRDGYWIIQNYNQRKIIRILAFCLIFSIGGLIFQSLKNTLIPYIVEVNPVTGEVKNVGKLENVQYKPNEAVIRYFLSQFISDARQIGLDNVVYQINQHRVRAFLTEQAAAKMSAEWNAEHRKEQFGQKTVQVQIVSILPVKGNDSLTNSYQVRWNEEEVEIGSAVKKTIPMTGIFTVKMIPPQGLNDENKDNPIGIYFSDFSFEKDSTAVNSKK
jgi:type IV secretion system protein TrbF